MADWHRFKYLKTPVYPGAFDIQDTSYACILDTQTTWSLVGDSHDPGTVILQCFVCLLRSLVENER